MNITKTVKLADGAELTVVLNEEQMSFLLGIAINFLLARGTFPFGVPSEEEEQSELDFDKPPESIN